MTLRTLERLVADRLDKKVLLSDANRAQGHDPRYTYYNDLMSFETNGLCLALCALMAESDDADPEHFPQPNLISEEWRAAHRSRI